MRAVYTSLLLALACGTVLAQAPGQNAPVGTPNQGEALAKPESLSGRGNQRTERIQIEDAGSRVDELRVGGQTQSISVQPKTGNMPSYEVQSPDGARGRTGALNGAETNTGPRVWNVLKF